MNIEKIKNKIEGLKNQQLHFKINGTRNQIEEFEGKILFQGTSEELAANPIVREKYLGRNFIFNRKKFD